MAEIEVTPASGEDWADFIARTNGRSGFTERVLLEVHQRLLAVEAAGGVARNPGHASVAPAGVSVEELADYLPANAWAGPEGYSRQAFARHLLDHPRIGSLLRGEGAPAPKRVVLPEEPHQAQAAHPIQPLIVDEHGTLRFKKNPIVRHLLDTHPSCGLNKLACMNFSDEDQQQFAQLIGYSLSGYESLSYASDASYDAAASTVHVCQQGGQADG